jgi:hypothetical protein
MSPTDRWSLAVTHYDPRDCVTRMRGPTNSSSQPTPSCQSQRPSLHNAQCTVYHELHAHAYHVNTYACRPPVKDPDLPT